MIYACALCVVPDTLRWFTGEYELRLHMLLIHPLTIQEQP